MIQTEKEQLQNMLQQLVVLLSDLNELEKTFSRLQNEAKELYLKLDETLDVH